MGGRGAGDDKRRFASQDLALKSINWKLKAFNCTLKHTLVEINKTKLEKILCLIIICNLLQLNEFRKVLDEQNRPLVNNYRPVQNLNGRQVLKSFQAPGYKLDDVQDNDGNGAGRPAGYFIALFVSVLSAVFKTMC